MEYVNEICAVDSTGAITIPQNACKKLRVVAGDEFTIAHTAGAIVLQKRGAKTGVEAEQLALSLMQFVNGMNRTTREDVNRFVYLTTDYAHRTLQYNLFDLIKDMCCSWAASESFDERNANVIRDCKVICEKMGWTPKKPVLLSDDQPKGFAEVETGCDKIAAAIRNLMTFANFSGYINQESGKPFRQFSTKTVSGGCNKASFPLEFAGQGYCVTVTVDSSFRQEDDVN